MATTTILGQELTLRHVLQQPTLLTRFKYYLQRDLAEENLVFLQTLQGMRSANAENPEPLCMARDVRQLISEFFLPSSPMELNIPSNVRKDVVATGNKLCDELEKIKIVDISVSSLRSAGELVDSSLKTATPDPTERRRRLTNVFNSARSRDRLDQLVTLEDLQFDPFLVFLVAEKHIERVLGDRLRAFAMQLSKPGQEAASEQIASLIRSPSSNKVRVVVIGGGFCGGMVAQLLDPMSRFDVTLIDTKTYFEYTPSIVRLIPDPAADSISYEHSAYIVNGQLVVSLVNEVTPTHIVAGNGQHTIPYDYLVVASGSSYASNIKADHMSSSYRSKKIQHEHAKLAAAKTVLVVGGGIVGVEVAAEVKSVYPDKQVTIVEANTRLMKRNASTVHNSIAKYLTDTLGIEIVLGDRVSMSDCSRGTFAGISGRIYKADMAYMCTGQVPRSDCMRSHFGEFIDDKGYVQVTPTHQLPKHPHIFCGGDVCSIGDERMASVARFAGVSIARNICRLVKGKDPIARGSKGTQPLTPQIAAYFVSLGRKTGSMVLNYKTALIGPRWLDLKLSFKDTTFKSLALASQRQPSYLFYMRAVYGRPPPTTANSAEKAATPVIAAPDIVSTATIRCNSMQ
ncbi:hypothetical protein RI367_007707 [Sorochytrium milnesiophthora]